ncbi:MAG TPA: hypothetical protein DC054_07760 [Blastocatellia bacterium]|nr:hypothetical protein [Blastocatellia bacterium]
MSRTAASGEQIVQPFQFERPRRSEKYPDGLAWHYSIQQEKVRRFRSGELDAGGNQTWNGLPMHYFEGNPTCQKQI